MILNSSPDYVLKLTKLSKGRLDLNQISDTQIAESLTSEGPGCPLTSQDKLCGVCKSWQLLDNLMITHQCEDI